MAAAVLALPRRTFALSCARQVARRRPDASFRDLAAAAGVLRLWGDYRDARKLDLRAVVEIVTDRGVVRILPQESPELSPFDAWKASACLQSRDSSLV